MNIDMAQMKGSLPEGLKAWAEARVAEGRYSSTSDYVRDLMRRDMEAAEARRRLEAAIGEGLASPVVDTTIDDIIARGRARHRSEEHTSELQSLMRISYAVFSMKKKTTTTYNDKTNTHKTHESKKRDTH